MENHNNHRNKKKLSKVVTELDIESLQDELRKNNKYVRHKPNRKPSKRRADRK